MTRIATLIYAAVAYLMFLAVVAYAIGFVGDFHYRISGDHYFVPQAIDFGRAPVSTAKALLIDGALLLLFAVQHSGMARQSFKARITRVISPAIERSTYVLVTNLVLVLLFWQWRAIGGIVWSFADGTTGSHVLHAVNLAGWGLAFVATFLINHFELFGLQQAYAHARGAKPPDPTFRQPFLYKWIRHPLYLGFLIAFWATPIMTRGHLIFAIAVTGYILVAVQFEERDLIRLFGEHYREYRERVPMLVPWRRAGKK